MKPAQEYTERRTARQEAANEAALRERRLSNARLVVFALGLGVGWLALGSQVISGWWIAAALALFVALIVLHDAAKRRHARARRAVAYYEAGLARLEYRFAGEGKSGERYVDHDHPYTSHMDVFGRGSLFELLCQAQTRAGEDRLAAWLAAPAGRDEALARQAAVEELRPRLDLREDMAVRGPEVVDGLHVQPLVEWGADEEALRPGAARWVTSAFTLATLAASGAAIFGGTGIVPLLVVLAAQSVFAQTLRKRVAKVIEAVERPAHEIELLGALLERLEPERFEAPLLAELRGALDTDGHPPSYEVARLRRLVNLLDARRNQFFAPLAPLLLWGTHMSFAIEGWRRDCGARLGTWIDALARYEALSDLASHAFEHPEDPFPEIAADAPRFEAQGIGHPLISEERCVRNHVSLDPQHALLVISGSNMSGKSTLLRSVGTNTVLALAGGTVRAHAMRVSALALGASLRIQDSLLDGTSRFYAEITTLQRTVALASGDPPLLFLLDEILQGTNSHDRRIGATEVVKGLVERGAIGMITTHDLALTEMVEQIGARARNVHFEDQLVDGRMVFDYSLQDGVVTRSNALDLMRAVGLDV